MEFIKTIIDAKLYFIIIKNVCVQLETINHGSKMELRNDDELGCK